HSAPPYVSPLSLHDALPISLEIARVPGVDVVLAANSDLGNFSGYQPTDAEYQALVTRIHDATLRAGKFFGCTNAPEGPTARADRSEEHTSELQSRGHLVCRL